MIQELLTHQEGKTLEFKQDASSLWPIAKTVVAFANTAGGTLVIGIEDNTKKIFGLTDPLDDEMRIINHLSASITPFFMPNIDIQSYRKKTLILIHVPYSVGPYYLKKESKEIAYVRFGSTNRIADADTIATIKSLAKNKTFDELPCSQAPKNVIDWESVKNSFALVNKEITPSKAKSIGLVSTQAGVEHPSNGGVLLFGKDRADIFPDAIIRCVRFNGTTKESSLDHREINEHLPVAVNAVLDFITKNTFTRTIIGAARRTSIPQYPPIAIRESVINAIVHADYSIKGSSIIVAIFDDRIEITNPGGLPYGLSMEEAIAGSSRSRNRVITRTFHVLELIEQWGSGLQKIINACAEHGIKEPKLEEMGSQFRITVYAEEVQKIILEEWQSEFLQHLQSLDGISTQDAAILWGIDIRNARNRLKKLIELQLITKIEISKNDPHGKYILQKNHKKTTDLLG